MAPKRKRAADNTNGVVNGDALPNRRSSARTITTAAAAVNPDKNEEVIDAPNALRASPDSDVNEDIVPGVVKKEEGAGDESPLSQALDVVEPPKKKAKAIKTSGKSKAEQNGVDLEAPVKIARGKKAIKTEDEDAQQSTAAATPAKKPKKEADGGFDPEAGGEEEVNEEEVKEALSRPPPVNSAYLPLPWTGRLGFACLNTYLRNSNPPVFSSRTCRIQSILEHRHPLQDPSQPEHPTKNRPDRSKPADVELGQRYVESLCLANVKDIAKTVRWNDRYNIRFFRLSSEMFPFASHPEYGYKLAPFATEALAEAGKVIAELGHRVTTHPGQFTQLGSPRKPVIDNAIRDLDYHDEMLSLLKLPEQQNRDAVMILHMGGMFEGKQETLDRFRANYANLSQGVKNRLVLENDDMGWSVHDLLPICEELNIPFVLDFHHHNIVFDADQIREGTKDIMELYPRIKATWDRKRITQKMHYSEPTPAAITPRQRRKHNPRVATLPPCPPDMDLMIEAKDKEQAVFELMRAFKLPGFNKINDVLPYVRNDDNKAALAVMNKKKKKAEKPEPELIPEEDVGMGGPEGRVYWPPGMEEWLRPKKREVKKKDPGEKSTEQKKKEAAELYAAKEAEKRIKDEPASEHDSDVDATPATKKAKAAMRAKQKAVKTTEPKETTKAPPKKGRAKKQPQSVPTPSSSDDMEGDELRLDDDEDGPPVPAIKTEGSRKGGRRSAKAKVNYSVDD
ncbi:hypothetical protein M409DRAFT_49486 [Zasmidium cellare ATCC 36951]|uniref:UV-endonuclease UvdE n=1 Tax=Zasmidium cellare ATCC 36951 TaxID=1080233 RepID=A0A6A6D5P5_ZASCE|nr:uncharacterized protein M409DRAFT_49486 [Zasmidium cellare ATCC 36951]KAF2172986.1 hypothetical protein M409DRAFT_49486 [Zasmidium cellare ATCC 36951]